MSGISYNIGTETSQVVETETENTTSGDSGKSNNSNINNNNINNNNEDNNIKSNMTSSSLKEPKTPSIPKFPTFSSPAVIVMPETPDRIPRQINDFEDTPLLSPPQSSNNHLLSTPQRRKGNTDFYSLLKSPDVRLDDNKLKRTSIELFGITNNKFPERDDKEYDKEHLLKSPRRDNKEIRKISENLKTRLNYANVKVQHGWFNKSIGELSHTLEEVATNPQRSSELNNKNLEDFWNLRTDNLPTSDNSETIGLKTSTGMSTSTNDMLMASPRLIKKTHTRRRSSFASGIKLDEIAKRGFKASPEITSNSEFLPSTITNSSLIPGGVLQTSPMKKIEKKDGLSITTKSSDKLEQDAIMSLISLSSPVKYGASGASVPLSLSPSPPRYMGSPTKPNHATLPSLNGISSKRLPPLKPPVSAPDIMANSINEKRKMLGMEASNNKSVDNNDRYILPNPPRFESRDLGMETFNTNNSDSYLGLNINNQVDQDVTDDETTEDELIDDDEVVITDRVMPTLVGQDENEISNDNNNYNNGRERNRNSIDGNNVNIFRTTKFNGVKMTSKKFQ